MPAQLSEIEARRLLHFLEYGLGTEFHRKVYLLEREFARLEREVDALACQRIDEAGRLAHHVQPGRRHSRREEVGAQRIAFRGRRRGALANHAGDIRVLEEAAHGVLRRRH